MIRVPETSDFRPELLSAREREVIDLAAEGGTDEEIAVRLRITAATVNSYWVRIRSKLGAGSRARLVAWVLRHDGQEANAGLVREVETLASDLAAAQGHLARARSDLAAARGASWHLLALRYAPEALLVAYASGHIAYANLQAERLFRAEPDALIGSAVCDLTAAAGARRHRIQEFLQDAVPGRLVMGLEEPCFAIDHAHTTFRATISVEGFEAPEGFMGVLTVRSFLDDVDAMLRSLRNPGFVV